MIILHCLARTDWAALPPDLPYAPRGWEAEGFIHCSDLDTFRYVAPNFREEPERLALLCIDTARLAAPVQWEDGGGGRLYPHIYGEINREAIGLVLPFLRDAAGNWLPNPELSEFAEIDPKRVGNGSRPIPTKSQLKSE